MLSLIDKLRARQILNAAHPDPKRHDPYILHFVDHAGTWKAIRFPKVVYPAV